MRPSDHLGGVSFAMRSQSAFTSSLVSHKTVSLQFSARHAGYHTYLPQIAEALRNCLNFFDCAEPACSSPDQFRMEPMVPIPSRLLDRSIIAATTTTVVRRSEGTEIPAHNPILSCKFSLERMRDSLDIIAINLELLILNKA